MISTVLEAPLYCIVCFAFIWLGRELKKLHRDEKCRVFKQWYRRQV